MNRKIAFFAAIFFIGVGAAILSGCGGGGGSVTATAPTSTTYAGNVSAPGGALAKGEPSLLERIGEFFAPRVKAFTGLSGVSGATVTLMQVNASTGAISAVSGVSTATTDASGNFELSVPSSVSVSTGASFLVSVGSGSTRMRAFLIGTSNVDIDPASELAVTAVMEEVGGGESITSFSLSEVVAIQTAIEAATVSSSGSDIATALANGRADAEADANVVAAIRAATNVAPTANAGTDQTVTAGEQVALSGSGSDANDDDLTFAWSQTSGATVALSSSSAQSPTFTPTVAGNYVFSLTVSDGLATSSVDTVTIAVQAANVKPTADAGQDQSATAGQQVTLNGSASSDSDGGTLIYAWTQTSGATVTLSSATATSPTFTPQTAGTYVFQLIVNDGEDDSDADSVTITVNAAPANNPPTANAGPDQSSVTTGDLVTLDGSGSSDADQDSLTYAWTQTSGASVTLSDATAAMPTFTPSTAGAYVFSLTVNDGTENSSADTVTITVSDPPNTAPVAAAGADQSSLDVAAVVTLDGSGSADANQDALTYSWTQTSGPSVTLSNASAQMPTFTPTQSGTYVFSLTVNDGTENSGADSVTITVDTWVVVYTNASGFSPASLTISVDDKVRWQVGGSGDFLQLAEGTHPTHTDCTYCPQGASAGATITITDGNPSTYQFTFAGSSTPHFHNHSNSSDTMTVTVQ